MNVRRFVKKSALVAALFAVYGVAQAASVALNPASAVTGTVNVPPIAVQFTGDGVVSFFEVEVKYDQTKVSGVAAGANGGACAANNGTGIVVVQMTDPGLNPLPAGPTSYCNVTFTVLNAGDIPAPGDPNIVWPLTMQNDLWGDGGGNPVPGNTATGGEIVLQGGPPPDVIVTFTPASGGTVTFPGGMPADVVTQSIAIGNTGTIGSGTVSGCVLGGADAGSFAITGGNPSTVPPATSLDLSATLGAAALNATLTCDVTDSGGTSTATWTLTAPAGTVLAAPTLSSNPASGTAITLPGSYGTPVSSNIVITPAGGDAGGPNASVTCSTGSAGFTVTPAGALTFTPPGGAAQNAVVGCTPGAAAITGTVTCTGTDQAGAIAWTYPVTCPAASTAPPPPTFVPASSLWSKLALFGVFAALGMLILGLRRNH
ncbi:hypothetical protein [Denitratimonas tolerans]|uniref:Ig-like domain-containing protein n=1 Tax=Denitratimonas tolerans TaxID=1338420 RepID=A0AAW9QZS0_9GAMM